MATSMGIHGLRHKRARLAGEFEQLKTLTSRHKETVAVLTDTIARNEARMQEIAKHIELLGEAGHAAFGVELPAPEPRQTIPKHHFMAWGGLTRGILAELTQANGRPMSAMQIAHALNATFELNLPPEQLTQLKKSVRYRLKNLRQKHVVVRIHAAHEIGPFSTWALKAFVE